MATTQESLSRQWLMLQWVPRYPRKTTARALVERLRAEDQVVTKRTVERDLAALSEVFPLACDDRTKPFGWSWQKDAKQFSLPGMSPLQAMVLKLASTQLQPLLPAHLLEPLAPYFRQANATLHDALGKRGVAEWSKRIAVVQPTQSLLPPKVARTVLAVVHEALARQHQIDMGYRSRSAAAILHYRVHPLGLVYRGVVGYLVGSIGNYQDVRQFALHRIQQARLLDEATCQPKLFDLESYAQSGAFGFMDNGLIKLVFRMESPAAQHLHETPLSLDQLIIDDSHAGWMSITATVHDTSQLRWWLLAYGDQVEVITPGPLRSWLGDTHQAAAKQYDQGEKMT